MLDSSLIGNRADDRGGAVAGEADVLVVNSTIARNLAVAHAGGGVWARGDLVLVNATMTDNYAEGEGGGVLAAGRMTVLGSTVTRQHRLGRGEPRLGGDAARLRLDHRAGDGRRRPPATRGPTRRSCRVYEAQSAGYNFVTDGTCELAHATDIMGDDPRLGPLEDDPKGFVLTPVRRQPGPRPDPDRPVRARAARRRSRPGQLLDRYVDWEAVRTRDATRQLRVTRARRATSAPSQSPPPPAERPPTASGARAPCVTPVAGGVAGRRRRSRGAAAPRRRRPAGSLGRLARRLRVLDRRSRRVDRLLALHVRGAGVDQAGDPRHRWGFRYDERDGTGLDRRTALVPARAGCGAAAPVPPARRARPRCLSAAPDPNGTGHAGGRGAAPPRRRSSAIAARVERRTERFDEWESCLSWLPVTEAGDAGPGPRASGAGGARRRRARRRRRREWDDPDYELAAFVGRDRPFGGRACDTEPGEGVVPARAAAPAGASAAIAQAERLARLRGGRARTSGEPVAEITRFDECLYTVGVPRRARLRLRAAATGGRERRAAFAFDMDGHAPAAARPAGVPRRGAAADRVQRGRRRRPGVSRPTHQ